MRSAIHQCDGPSLSRWRCSYRGYGSVRSWINNSCGCFGDLLVVSHYNEQPLDVYTTVHHAFRKGSWRSLPFSPSSTNLISPLSHKRCLISIRKIVFPETCIDSSLLRSKPPSWSTPPASVQQHRTIGFRDVINKKRSSFCLGASKSWWCRACDGNGLRAGEVSLSGNDEKTRCHRRGL